MIKLDAYWLKARLQPARLSPTLAKHKLDISSIPQDKLEIPNTISVKSRSNYKHIWKLGKLFSRKRPNNVIDDKLTFLIDSEEISECATTFHSHTVDAAWFFLLNVEFFSWLVSWRIFVMFGTKKQNVNELLGEGDKIQDEGKWPDICQRGRKGNIRSREQCPVTNCPTTTKSVKGRAK